MTMNSHTRKYAAALCKSVVALGVLALPLTPSTAAVQSFEATVTRTLSAADDNFGGCMVALSEAPSDHGLNCPAGKSWVTFSCSGTHAGKASAMRMLDSAQLAFVTGRPVRVWVDDSRTHNGFCFVTRIDVLSP